jgi:hypothetical protein
VSGAEKDAGHPQREHHQPKESLQYLSIEFFIPRTVIKGRKYAFFIKSIPVR